MSEPPSPDRAGRPDDDDYDLLTVGEARARLSDELVTARQHLEALEERLGYLGEDRAVASQIAEAEHRVEALQAAQERISRPPSERLLADIAKGSERLEVLEERFFYIGEDADLAARIGDEERRIEHLKSQRPDDEAGAR